MGQEIERKFLVANDGWRAAATGSKRLRQGYLAHTEAATVRVRIAEDPDGAEATITIKSARGDVAREEYEYPIPADDARGLMALALGRPVEKRRHVVPADPGTWEVDVFEGEHAGLVLAEIELAHEAAPFARPDWLGEEVTGDPRYYNVTLAGLTGGDG